MRGWNRRDIQKIPSSASPSPPQKRQPTSSGKPCARSPEWLEEFTDNLKDTVKCQHPQTFLMTQVRNVHESGIQEGTVFILTSPKPEIAKSASESRRQGLFAEGVLAMITKFTMRAVNLDTTTDIQSWYKMQPLNVNIIRAKPKIFRRRKGFEESFSICQQSRQSFALTIIGRWQNLVKTCVADREREKISCRRNCAGNHSAESRDLDSFADKIRIQLSQRFLVDLFFSA